MSRSTEALIAELAAGARPVRRLRPPTVRAGLWLAGVMLVAAAGILRFADLAGFVRRTAGPQPGLAWIAALATGAVAVVAAAHLALPDRSRRWALAPLPFLALWLAASGWGCLGLPVHPDGDSRRCFVFVLASGLPLTAFLVWRLARARPLDAPLVAVMAALGAAGLSAALLQFFHPFPITWLDLGVHMAAAAVLLAAGGVGGAIGQGRKD